MYVTFYTRVSSNIVKDGVKNKLDGVWEKQFEILNCGFVNRRGRGESAKNAKVFLSLCVLPPPRFNETKI